MERRQMLAVLSSVGVTAIAGCSGGNGNGNGGSNGGDSSSGNGGSNSGGSSSNGEGCVPETDDLPSLLPPEDSGDFQGIRQVTSGVDVGTDNFVIGRYEGPDGNENDLLIAEYSSSSAAEENIQTVRSAATKPVMGILVDGPIVVAVDAQSEQKARDLLSASDIGCAGQLSFSSGGSSTGTEESFSIGDPIWSQRNGSSGTRGANVAGIQSDDPSSYSIGAAYEPVITQNAVIAGNQIYDAADGSAVRQLAASATDAPAIVGDKVVMIADSDVVAVNVESGDEEWRYTTASPARSIAAGEQNVYVGTEGGITALSLSEGERAWDKQNLARPPREENTGIGVVGGGVYITRLNQGVMFDTSDGSLIFGSDGPVIKAIFAPDGSIYEQRGTMGGSLVKVDSEGNRLWGTGGSSTPYGADEGHVYATTNPARNEGDSGFMTAHNADDGSIDWSFEIPNAGGGVGVESAAVGSDRVFVSIGQRIFAVNKSSGEREAIYSTDRYAQSLALGEGLLALVKRGGGNEGTTFLVE